MTGIRTRFCAAFLLLILLPAALGCAGTKKEEEQTQLEFTVVNEERLPEELKQIVEEKKGRAFSLTFADGGYLYLCTGYGKQDRGGYSIAVNSLYATENGIYLDVDLIGPKEPEAAGSGPSYPYIVIKTPFMDKTVVFD